MCFSAMLTELQMEYYFDNIAIGLSDITWIIPVVIFVSAMLLTSLLGSSWAMYVLTFPLVIRLGALHAINLPLCCGAVCAAGIAGEKNCMLSGDAMVVATALGINPEVVLKLRLKYSAAFSILTALFYLVAGRFM